MKRIVISLIVTLTAAHLRTTFCLADTNPDPKLGTSPITTSSPDSEPPNWDESIFDTCFDLQKFVSNDPRLKVQSYSELDQYYKDLESEGLSGAEIIRRINKIDSDQPPIFDNRELLRPECKMVLEGGESSMPYSLISSIVGARPLKECSFCYYYDSDQDDACTKFCKHIEEAGGYCISEKVGAYSDAPDDLNGTAKSIKNALDQIKEIERIGKFNQSEARKIYAKGLCHPARGKSLIHVHGSPKRCARAFEVVKVCLNSKSNNIDIASCAIFSNLKEAFAHARKILDELNHPSLGGKSSHTEVTISGSQNVKMIDDCAVESESRVIFRIVKDQPLKYYFGDCNHGISGCFVGRYMGQDNTRYGPVFCSDEIIEENVLSPHWFPQSSALSCQLCVESEDSYQNQRGLIIGRWKKAPLSDCCQRHFNDSFWGRDTPEDKQLKKELCGEIDELVCCQIRETNKNGASFNRRTYVRASQCQAANGEAVTNVPLENALVSQRSCMDGADVCCFSRSGLLGLRKYKDCVSDVSNRWEDPEDGGC